VWAHADETRMDQVITNLLDNAVKHTPAGGRIDVALRADGPWAVLRIEDSGIGIPADRLTRIFEPFYQGEPSLDRTPGGLGLGLAVVRRLVAEHGGMVTAASEGHGHGSTFTVRLPRVTPLPPPAIASAARATTASSRRVVVVEDNTDSREMLDRLLRMEGHEVHSAEDGASALEVVARVVPDVVLIDIGLPGLDGYEVARRLRDTPAGRSMLLVAMTGYGQPRDRLRALEAGFDDHLVKPIELGRLRALIARAGPG
jgi:CheY-like chemotaxis protein